MPFLFISFESEVRIIISLKLSMKSNISLLLVIITSMTTIINLKAQTNNTAFESSKKSPSKIEMLFPEGKSKALILSYDDGRDTDRRLVQLMNKYGLVGTFNLNSNKLDTKEFLAKKEIKSLYKGHEVALHTANHPFLTRLSRKEIISEVGEDRRELEMLTGSLVRGLAYPFGDYNDSVVTVLKGLGVEYARTVNDTHDFSLSSDFLKWNPTTHQFAEAFSTPNDSNKDKKELDFFYMLVNNFLKTDHLALLNVWGHSWEYKGVVTDWEQSLKEDSSAGRWYEVEHFFKMVSKNPQICYTTQIGLADYLNAYNNLKFSIDGNTVVNLSSTDVFLKMDGKALIIKVGCTKHLTH